MDVLLKWYQNIIPEDTDRSQFRPQRVVQCGLQVCHVHPGPVHSKIPTRQQNSENRVEVFVLPAMFIPVEGSPGFVCLVGDSFYGDWCRFPWSHHPRQPLEGVRVKGTSLDDAERAKKRQESSLICCYVPGFKQLYSLVLCSCMYMY